MADQPLCAVCGVREVWRPNAELCGACQEVEHDRINDYYSFLSDWDGSPLEGDD